MKKLCLIFFFTSIIILTPLALSQGTQLIGGEANFEVKPVVLKDIPIEENQYCGNPADPRTINPKLALVGDPDFLNIRWDVRDLGGVERQIGIDCWMNCNLNRSQILVSGPAGSNMCDSKSVGTCSYTGPTGDHACTIQNPAYSFNSENKVSCRFYDVIDPIQGLEVEERIFKTVDFVANSPSTTVTIGSSATLPVSVKSFGILDSSFTVNTTALNSGFLVNIKNDFSNTDIAACGEAVQTFPSLFFLSAKRIPFSILTHSSADQTICNVNSECSYLGDDSRCVSSKCWSRIKIDIEAGIASLPEYNMYGLLIIIFASSVIFARRKVRF